jgi:putative heme-binding domain-containing protein
MRTSWSGFCLPHLRSVGKPFFSWRSGRNLTYWLLLVLAVAPAAAGELPVRDGLEVWYDAQRLEAPDEDLPFDGVSVAVWPDASGHGRDARQEHESARPQLVAIGDDRVVRFDGEDDHLRVLGLDRSLEAATVFIVAAPRSNAGGFRGFLSANEPGKRDYETGFTIDQGPGATLAFSQINVEGRGFLGAQNLTRTVSPFGAVQTIEVVISPADKSVRLLLDGKLSGERPFDPAPLRIDELTIGARHYSFAGEPPLRGWIAADFAEILLYRRALTEDEREQVRHYLSTKYADLRETLADEIAAAEGKPLESILNPPPLQMFVPGFVVRELPLSLPNINNIRYRPDGTLVALAYNGNVFLLSDTNGDGLEDQATAFWTNEGRIRSPIGMTLTPPGYDRGEGLFVATKSECLLLTDTNGDGKADTETVVASGWSESFHNVDALGVAIDPEDGSVYFGLGTANFADPWLRDQEGKPHYRLDGERSAILKVAPDFSRREVYCTGIRFPVALAFNRHGDLFCTDQEGATWVPNGNPLDELLHLQRGRHYGFPPRHPRLLPDVVDEPSTYDYGPQHQSTCGLIFNEPVVEGGSSFGPEFWDGDAIVTGYSRGKLYRTKLAKTSAGYVADNRLLACLNMLTVDSCVTPQGGLVVAVHSGGPDWGSGPGGEGKLYKIDYEDRNLPQPVAVWAASPTEVTIAFDKPLNLEHLRGLADEAEITYGEHVRAGDEFESLRPGYELVARQVAAPRYDLRVHSAQVTPDGRTVMLATDPQTAPYWHAIRLPGLGRPSREESERGGTLPQYPRIDLDYTLGGVSAAWDGELEGFWTGWLPHLDLDVARAFTRGSALHDELWKQLEQPGRLRLQTQLDLANMLRAKTQPGSQLDYTLPPERVTLSFRSSSPFTLIGPGDETVATAHDQGYVATFEYEVQDEKHLVPIELSLKLEGGPPQFTVAWHTAEDRTDRPLATHRMLLPWVRPVDRESESLAERVVPELDGGSWARGRAVFFSEAAACAKCHTVHGQGGIIGPDLSNLVHRDYASVLRDIADPSYAVNPDYIAHVVVLKDGRVLTGTLRSEGDRLWISDHEANVIEISRDDIEELAPSTKSIMPEGLPRLLGPDRLRDLMTFLLTKPPHLPTEGAGEPPPPRPRDELAAVLAGAPNPPEPTRPIRVVLVAGEKDHGPGEHDYPAWQTAWAELLSAGRDVEVGTAWEWPSTDDFATADVLVFYQKGTWTPERARDIDAYLARGGGLVYIHYAVDGGADAPGFAQRIGLAWQGGRSKFRHGPLELGFDTGDAHPIARNFSTVKFVDESYWQLVGDADRIRLMATAIEDGRPQPLFWTIEPAKGRVFVSIPGHYSWTFDDPLFRVLLLRGIAWAAKEPVDRFNELVTPGARIAD